MSYYLRRFCFHKPSAEGVAHMKAIRVKVRELARLIAQATLYHPCEEQREAFNHLQMVMMNANSAIVQQYPIDPSDLTEEEMAEFVMDEPKQ